MFEDLEKDIELLRDFPWFMGRVDGLLSESNEYISKCEEYGKHFHDSAEFFEEFHNELPNFLWGYGVSALLQPSSCAAERVFSLLNDAQDESQERSLSDVLQAIVMLRYNRGRKDKSEEEEDAPDDEDVLDGEE
jgi:hypothetical protein